MAAGETTRDLVIRLRFEKVGGDFQPPDFKAPANDARQYGSTVDQVNNRIKEYTQETSKMADATRRAAEATRQEKDVLAEVKKELLERINAGKQRIDNTLEQIKAQKGLADADALGEEASKRFTLALRRQYDLGIVETVNRLARGVAFLAASNEDSAEKMARNVIQFQAAVDLFRGTAETIARLRNVYIGLTLATEAYAIATKDAAASQLALNGAQAAGAATGAASGGATFLGVGGRAGSFLAGAAGLLTSPLGLATVAVGGVLGARALANRESARIQEGRDSYLEGIFNNRFLGGLLDFSGGSSTGLASNLELRQAEAAAFQSRIEAERNAQGGRSTILGLRAQLTSGDLASTQALIRELQGNIAVNQGIASNPNFGSLDRAFASGRIVEDLKQVERLLNQERQIKEETSRESIRTEEHKLTLLERQLHTAEREFEKRQREFDRGIATFAELRPFEQRRALDAAEKLRGGQELNRREIDVIQRLNAPALDDLLQKQLERQALAAGAAAIFGEKPDDALVRQQKDAVERQQKLVDDLKQQAKDSGEQMGKTIRAVIQQMLEAATTQIQNEEAADKDVKSAQSKAVFGAG